MDIRYSAEYTAFIDKIRTEQRVTPVASQTRLKRIRECMRWMTNIALVAMVLGIISLVVCLVSIFRASEKGTIISAVIFAVLLAYCVLTRWMNKAVLIPLIRAAETNGPLDDGDKFMLEQRTALHTALAGYCYYRGAERGDAIARQRLHELMGIPEFQTCFRDNGLAFDKTQNAFKLKTEILAYREFVTEHCGIKTDHDYAIFFRTNSMMFENRVLAGPAWNNARGPASDTDIFRLAQSHHERWWAGDPIFRDYFVAIFRKPEVLRAYKAEREKNASMFAGGMRVSYSETHSDFMGILHAVANDAEHTSEERC